jgi:hypothetical protein
MARRLPGHEKAPRQVTIAGGNAVKQACALLLLVVLGSVAVRAETAFPLNRGFRAISIDGRDLMPARPRTAGGRPTSFTTRLDRDGSKRLLNLVVKLDAERKGFVAYGRAACNVWGATVVFGDSDRITFDHVYQTAVACGSDRPEVFPPVGTMRWQMEGDILSLQGEEIVLRFRAAH